MCWHKANPDRWNQEQAIASQLLDNFEAEITSSETAIIRGSFDVCSENGHLYESVKLRIEYPAAFPLRNQPPSVYLESHRDRWKNSGDSHIEGDWRLCLFVPGESGIEFADASSLNDLFAVIQTFLFKQHIFQKRLAKSFLTGEGAKWLGEDRSHGEEGIREAIRAKGGVGRNESCPCGSGKKYKHCHLRKFQR
ncbi:SEC-C metal-binding domain-containing protein [Fuerstiella marisgermanici]|uniref:Preprotein translocase subunit n=1 Tax=Fuerstiella marisgermanici TaxID=1891926 RepID=A0A1P8WGY5_9PLAN|nr:SEC-C metal-binding domain-containing protein [Fuerstiella marisgermanici]APZ93313.1 preprotein translocase subunit [Fuerstiella marisgermanici]